INENDLFKHGWRSRSRVEALQYIFLKWLLAFLVGFLTGIIATLINLAVENIAGYKFLVVLKYINTERYLTAAGPGIPEIKAYLNGVDTPNMYGATTLIVK
ncbi:chloride channel protein CLC-b-like, partial [Trifolium medium]|nr:chloride channel protein CLC-b-like [Trifolium medium]